MDNSDYFTVRELGDVTIIRFQQERIVDDEEIGELANRLTDLVTNSPRKKLVLDFSLVEQLSSAMFGKLIALNRLLGKRNGRLALFGLSLEVQEIVKVLKLDRLLTIKSDEHAALAATG